MGWEELNLTWHFVKKAGRQRPDGEALVFGVDLETLASTAGEIGGTFELKIVDGQGNELPDGQVGEILVRGPFLMKGYLNNPDAARAAIDADGWFHTTDLAMKDERATST